MFFRCLFMSSHFAKLYPIDPHKSFAEFQLNSSLQIVPFSFMPVCLLTAVTINSPLIWVLVSFGISFISVALSNTHSFSATIKDMNCEVKGSKGLRFLGIFGNSFNVQMLENRDYQWHSLKAFWPIGAYKSSFAPKADSNLVLDLSPSFMIWRFLVE